MIFPWMESSQITLADKPAAEALAALAVEICRISAGRTAIVAARAARGDINITGLFTCGWVSAFRYLGPGDGAEKPRPTLARFSDGCGRPCNRKTSPAGHPSGRYPSMSPPSNPARARAPFGRAVDKIPLIYRRELIAQTASLRERTEQCAAWYTASPEIYTST